MWQVPIIISILIGQSSVSYITESLIRRTRRFPLEEQDIFTLPEHQRSSTIFFNRVRVAQSLLFCGTISNQSGLGHPVF
jgi:hypothetical protein